jgi:hypothetical protein
MKYFEVMVQITNESEDSKGNVRIKKNREIYLVDAMSCTEAEARVVNLFKNFSQDFEVVSVRSSKVIEVVSAEPKKVTKSNNDKTTEDDKDNG